MNSKWEYGNYAEKYDMTGDIRVGTGILRVHDMFDKLPDFMREADIIFSDPPYNQSAMSSYYTKANLPKRTEGFCGLQRRFMECVDIIEPKVVCLETGVKQESDWAALLSDIGYTNQLSKDSYYYGNKNLACKIIFATKSGTDIPEVLQKMPLVDEEKVIEYICQNYDFNCIGDLCMGKGLVAFYANKYGKRFVGTELNVNRLAVCVERVSTGEKGKIN